MHDLNYKSRNQESSVTNAETIDFKSPIKAVTIVSSSESEESSGEIESSSSKNVKPETPKVKLFKRAFTSILSSDRKTLQEVSP